MCESYPLGGAGYSAVEGGFDYDVLGSDGFEELLTLGGCGDADEFFVECDGYGRFLAEFGHIGPLVGFDGLLDGVYFVGCELFEAL